MGSFAQGALIQQLTSTATSGGTTTLTASSTTWQRFTGTSDETVVLPDATTMKDGRTFLIENRSTGELTVQFNGGTEAAKIASGTERDFNLYDNGSSAGDWAVSTQVNIDQPLGIRATRFTADQYLHINANQVQDGNGTISSVPPLEDLLVSFSGATIDFQNGLATGAENPPGSVTSEGGTFTLPSVTLNNYVRLVFTYVSAATPYIDSKFSAQNAAQASLEDPGTLFAALEGLPIGYVDLQSTGTGSYNFRTADAGSSVIKNEEIYNFGSSAGGGSGGDDSFKIQTVATDGTTTIKGGYLAISDGREIATYDGSGSASTDFGGDLSIDLDNLVSSPSSNTSYYLYVDTSTLSTSPTVTSDTGRELYPVQEAQLSATTTAPEDINLSRYIPLGVVRYATSNWSTTVKETYSTKKHPISVLASSLEYTMPYATIGSVGSSSQIRAGHILTANSFPSGATVYFWNLNDVNDDSGNSKTLTNNGSGVFTDTDILGNATNTYAPNGTTQSLSRSDSDLNVSSSFTFGLWFKPDDATPSSDEVLASGSYSAGDLSWEIKLLTSGNLGFYATNTAGSYDVSITGGSSVIDTGWHFACIVFDDTANTLTAYLNGDVLGTPQTLSSLRATTTADIFRIAARYNTAADYFAGSLDEALFSNDTAFSAEEIRKTYANKISHNKGIGGAQQHWVATVKNSDLEYPITDFIADKDTNDLYADFDQEETTSQVELKMHNVSATGRISAVRTIRKSDTATNIDALMPLTHNLPEKPTSMELWVLVSSYWELHDAGSYFKISDTQIASTGTTLTSTLGGSTNVILVASVGGNAIYSSANATGWTTIVTSSATTANNNEEHFADTSGGTFTITLPGSPSLGYRVRFVDFDGSWSGNNLTVDRNGNNINGSASNLTLTSGAAELVFNGTDDWRRVI